MIASFFSLRNSKRTLRHAHKLYTRKSKTLDQQTKESVQAYLVALRAAILDKDSEKAKKMALELEKASLRLMPKTSFDKIRDFLGGIVFALLVAVLIRTMWFELYTIPSGSMRPTLKEEDYLVVSKTDYGINVPLQESHFYFDPSLVKRGSIVVFNGANMDIEDSDTTYFYLFPGKKQFVKRLIGKPGDTLYFYGGQIYGIDAEGNELNLSDINQLEHIPFIRFDGKVESLSTPRNGVFSSVVFHQMNIPVAELALDPIGSIRGHMIAQNGKQTPTHYSDLWGMKHFAMSRLLTKEQLQKIHPNVDVEEGLLYLELTHHPTLVKAQMVRDEYNRLRPELATSTSIIPLQERHLNAISKHMTTCRFSVKDEVAYRIGWNPKQYANYLPKLPGVPNGTYEIQDGKAYKLPFPQIPILGIFTNGYTKQLPADHPLHSQDPQTVHKLYNLGIELLKQYEPSSKGQRAAPSRYAYFKNQDLYLLGTPVITKDDPTLFKYYLRENQKQAISTSFNPYFPFADTGAPSLEEIRKNGVRVPEKMYLALGDNHAMSADSRQFGFVPEDNLKGSVSFLFSPPGERWGRAPQPEISYLTFPNITVWTAFILTSVCASFYYRRKLKKPLEF
ncbi:MAG: signal peptidase I [Chlamydiae bacterium CG10_big_fil_rev_8_21_14_0_10_42_34]|nr:MAG: signal peptidase I [Chlamydiae bacterium CG10_big_fil_rev_8_21_14_0_10_42_34]